MVLGVEAIIDVLAPGTSIFSIFECLYGAGGGGHHRCVSPGCLDLFSFFRIRISRDHTGVGFLMTLRAYVGAADRRRHEISSRRSLPHALGCLTISNSRHGNVHDEHQEPRPC